MNDVLIKQLREDNSKDLSVSSPHQHSPCSGHRNLFFLSSAFLLFSACLGLIYVAGAVAGKVAPLLRLGGIIIMQLSRAEVGARSKSCSYPNLYLPI